MTDLEDLVARLDLLEERLPRYRAYPEVYGKLIETYLKGVFSLWQLGAKEEFRERMEHVKGYIGGGQ